MRDRDSDPPSVSSPWVGPCCRGSPDIVLLRARNRSVLGCGQRALCSPRTTTGVSLDREIRRVQTETALGQERLNSVASLHIEQGTGADAQQSALVPRSRSWARLTAGVRRQFIRVSAAGRRDEATDKSIWRAAEDGPSVRVLAPQYGVIRHPEPAGIIGIVGKDQDLPMALLDPRLGRRAIVHCAA